MRVVPLCTVHAPPLAHPTVLGKAEGKGENWHGHVTAVTIAPAYRRQRLADKFMKLLEDVTEHMCGVEMGWLHTD